MVTNSIQPLLVLPVDTPRKAGRQELGGRLAPGVDGLHQRRVALDVARDAVLLVPGLDEELDYVEMAERGRQVQARVVAVVVVAALQHGAVVLDDAPHQHQVVQVDGAPHALRGVDPGEVQLKVL